MRPLLLTIEGINSFTDAQTLDFTRVGADNIFCISGCTGSGKTTVLINRIANRIIEMQPDGVTEYIGNYDDYIERKNRPVAVEAEAGKTKTELEKEKRREKLSRQALRQLKIRAQEAEKAVGVKEAEIAELEAQMADPSLYSDAQKSADVQRAYQKAQQALQTLYEQWEAAEAALSQEEA